MVCIRHPRIAQRKSGIKDWHLVVFVLCLLLVDVVMLTAYTFLEGFVAHFNVGMESNKENPSDIVGVSFDLFDVILRRYG